MFSLFCSGNERPHIYHYCKERESRHIVNGRTMIDDMIITYTKHCECGG